MSWDSNRTSKPQKSKDEIVFHLRQVNAILEQLAFDSSLTDDLRDETVAVAIKHWTNEARLSPDQAAHLQDNYRVVSVLQKITTLQNCCRQLNLPVPLELFLARKTNIDLDYLSKSFGSEVGKVMLKALAMCEKEESVDPSIVSAVPTSSKIKKEPVAASERGTEVANSSTCTSITADTTEKANAGQVLSKKTYGPSVEDDDEGNYTDVRHENIDTTHTSTSILWSRRYKLTDASFTTQYFLSFAVLELFLIVATGLVIAFLLKLADIL